MSTPTNAKNASQPGPVALAVEGPRDATILRALLGVGTGTQDTRFFAAQGSISLASLARNILIQEGIPTMVVTDGGLTPPERVRSEQLSAIESVAPAAPFGAFVFSPSLDAIVSEAIAQQRDTAAPTPQSADPARPEQSLDPKTLLALRNHPQIKAFIESVADLQANRAAPYADHDL
jgi:hypothetical protein